MLWRRVWGQRLLRQKTLQTPAHLVSENTAVDHVVGHKTTGFLTSFRGNHCSTISYLIMLCINLDYVIWACLTFPLKSIEGCHHPSLPITLTRITLIRWRKVNNNTNCVSLPTIAWEFVRTLFFPASSLNIQLFFERKSSNECQIIFSFCCCSFRYLTKDFR